MCQRDNHKRAMTYVYGGVVIKVEVSEYIASGRDDFGHKTACYKKVRILGEVPYKTKP